MVVVVVPNYEDRALGELQALFDDYKKNLISYTRYAAKREEIKRT